MYSKIADVSEDRLGEFPTGLPIAAVEKFELKGSEEALSHGVVEGDDDGSQGAEQANLAEPLPEHPEGVLGSIVGMVDDLTRNGLASPADHAQGDDHQTGAQVIGDGPAEHPLNQTSTTTARHTFPSKAACSAMSATQNRSGPAGWNWRMARPTEG